MNFGLIAGIMGILYGLIGYLVNPKIYVNWWASSLVLIAYIVLYIMAVAKVKKEQGGFIVFRDAFTSFVIASIIAGITGVIFNLLLFQVIDPDFQQEVQEMTIEKSVEMMERFGAPEATIDEQIEKLEETNNYSLGNQGKRFFFIMLFNIVVGLIVAAVMKKNPPLVDETMDTDTE